jgi:hypothetical protein
LTGITSPGAPTALGQIAKRYYAGGRRMNAAVLQKNFSNLLGPAKHLQTQYLSQIRQKSSTIDAKRILAPLRNA